MNFRRFIAYSKSVGSIMVLDRLVGLALGMVLARWLGVEGYGIYAFAMAVLVMLMVPAKWGQPDLLLRETAWANAGQSAFGFGLERWSALLILLASALIALIALPVLFLTTVEGAHGREAIFLALVLLPAASLLDLICAGLRGAGRVVTAAWMATLLPGLLLLGLMLAAYFLKLLPSLPDVAMALRLGATLLVLFVAFQSLSRLEQRTTVGLAENPGLRWMLARGWPFMLLSGSAVLMSRSDLFFLGLFGTATDLAYYNVALQGAILVDFGLQLTNSITTQEFAHLYAANRKQDLQDLARSTARFTLALGLAVFVVLAFAGDLLISILFGAAFTDAQPILMILAAGKVLALVFGEPGFILNMSGNERLTLQIFSIMAVINVVLCLLIVPIWGARGAAVAAMSSLFLWRLFAWLAVRRRVGISSAVF